MPTHIRITPPAERDPNRKREHHADGDVRPGWAKPREKAGDEPRMTNLNMSLGKWIARAEKHSGPQYAPGIRRKSS